jgi:RNA polymerase sigma factor (TIGR02999 family)
VSDTAFNRLLSDLRRGERQALDELFTLVYEQLRQSAHRQLWGQPEGHTLNTTALVHETWIKLADAEAVDVNDRRHFFRLAARAMRQILIDHARKRLAAKRPGEAVAVDLDALDVAIDDRAVELLALDAALVELTRVDPRLTQVVELRFFGGLSVVETADMLELTPTTIKRDWRKARLYLNHALRDADVEARGGRK